MLRKNSLKPPEILSLTCHSGHMKNWKIQAWLLGILTILLGAAWALVVWVAMQVSGIVLDTLSAIVELAQLS